MAIICADRETKSTARMGLDFYLWKNNSCKLYEGEFLYIYQMQ